jgi:pyridoxal phosphate enzyme (YggS family)
MGVKENITAFKATLPPGVTLVAVSKTKPTEMIMEAYEAGQRDFGENYVQELVEKYEQLPKDIRWHFIGHLQSNKVKYIAPFVHLIHGVDSLRLLREINKQGARSGRVISCLLQIYIAREESKFGFDAAEVRELMASGELQELSHITVTGLMGMASNTGNESQVKAEFENLDGLFSELKKLTVPGLRMEHLSCGMSGDYRLALAAGSNMLRIGSTIFGGRSYLPKNTGL